MAKKRTASRAKVKKPARKRTPKKRSRKAAEPHTAVHKKAFLEALGRVGIIKYAAEVTGIGRRTHYDWLADDPEYAEAVEDAQAEAVETLETELHKRAMGIDGRQPSDALLRFYLRALQPDKYNRSAMPTPLPPPPQQHIVVEVTQRGEDIGPQPEPTPTKIIRIGEPRKPEPPTA